MAENSDFLKEQKGTARSSHDLCVESELSGNLLTLSRCVSSFREGREDSEGEGAGDLQREEGK